MLAAHHLTVPAILIFFILFVCFARTLSHPIRRSACYVAVESGNHARTSQSQRKVSMLTSRTDAELRTTPRKIDSNLYKPYKDQGATS